MKELVINMLKEIWSSSSLCTCCVMLPPADSQPTRQLTCSSYSTLELYLYSQWARYRTGSAGRCSATSASPSARHFPRCFFKNSESMFCYFPAWKKRANLFKLATSVVNCQTRRQLAGTYPKNKFYFLFYMLIFSYTFSFCILTVYY